MPIDIKNPNFEYIETQEELNKTAAVLSREAVLAVDLEADALDPYTLKVLLLQIGTEDKAYVFNGKLDLTPLKEILLDERILKLLQNGKFDYEALKASKGFSINNIYDTMLAERILTTGLIRENSLGAIAKKYLNITLDKDYENYNWQEVGLTGRITQKHLKYAALDVLVLFPIFKKQFEEIKKQKLIEVSKLEFRLLPVVAEMELRGTRIDVKKWHQNIEALKARRDEIVVQIQRELKPYYKIQQVDLFGSSDKVLNLNSPIQIVEAFRKLGIDLPSTGEAVLRKVNHPVAQLMLQYREAEKLITAFGENFLEKIHKKTKRIHPDFMQIGADTGRFACSNPNLQQIPQDSSFRGCFIPAEGYKLVVADYSQIELRIMAELSGDKVFLGAFDKGEDLHMKTAVNMYNVKEEQVDKKMRTAAKTINFGLMYGRGAASIGAQIGVGPDEARVLLDKYFKAYEGVKAWLDKAGKQAVKDGYSQTLSGRKRWYIMPDKGDPNYERLLANIERQGKNTPIQGSSADITKYALINIYDRIKKEGLDAYITHTVHDEIVTEAKESDVAAMTKVISEEMVNAGRQLLKKVKVEVDVKASDFWEH
ncbi:MAG: DNA polymerase [Patescibacteria group bacterium]|nr:DNA polymerase [Patescibacteria group bacterium]